MLETNRRVLTDESLLGINSKLANRADCNLPTQFTVTLFVVCYKQVRYIGITRSEVNHQVRSIMSVERVNNLNEF